MQLVVLAAGHGRRFGGLKQLAPVGPNGEAIMDYTAYAAQSCGYAGVVVVVREEIADEIRAHVRKNWPAGLDVEFVCQPPLPGTAQAVVSAKGLIDGPFGVANADDLYGEAAFADLIGHFPPGAEYDPARAPHLLVSYRLVQTVLTNGPLSRGLIAVSPSGCLDAIVEHTVRLRDDGRFDATPFASNDADARRTTPESPQVLSGDEPVSMNLWGFHPRILAELEAALERFDPEHAPRPELLLADVVGQLVDHRRDEVQVRATTARSIGLTNPEDLDIVRDELALQPISARAARTR